VGENLLGRARGNAMRDLDTTDRAAEPRATEELTRRKMQGPGPVPRVAHAGTLVPLPGLHWQHPIVLVVRRYFMKKGTRRSILILTLALVGAVPGCDAYRTVRQCGSQGCPADRRITAEIESLLAEHTALMPPSMVYVQTLDGVVYLSGQVMTPLQRTEAEDVAREAAGVKRVVNTISVGYRG